MPAQLMTADDFRAAVQAGERPEATLFKFAAGEPKSVAGAARTKRFTFSDEGVDHANDKIAVAGWNLGVFRSNPVALFSHMSMEPPIGRASNVAVRDDKLIGDIEFASADVYPFADQIFRLVDGGFLRACSVGFKPDEYSFSNDKKRPLGIDFRQQTLLEISICAVPANPSALIQARAAGIDTRPLREWAERVLDSTDAGLSGRRDIEAVRRQAAEPRRGRTTKSAATVALNRVVDDIQDSIAASRQTVKDCQGAMADPDAAADPGLVEEAMGHVREAIARKGQAVSRIRQALALAPNNGDPDPTPAEPAVVASAARRRALTPAQRLAEVDDLRRAIERSEEIHELLPDLRDPS